MATDLSQSTRTSIPNVQDDCPTAFISASAAVDSSVVREALRQRGYRTIALDEIVPHGRSIAEVLKDSLAGADLVVALIGDEPGSRNVYYELGFAQACEKRVLALAPAGIAPPVEGVACLRTEPTNREAIEFGLDQVLAAPHPKPRARRSHGRETKPIGDLADLYLADLRAEGPLPPDVIAGSPVMRSLLASGVTAFSYPVARGPNIAAIWSDDFGPWIGNPLIIAIEQDLNEGQTLVPTVEWLSGYLRETGTRCGLLLCSERDSSIVEAGRTTTGVDNVLILAVEQLLKSLKTEGFGNLMRRLYHERHHTRG